MTTKANQAKAEQEADKVTEQAKSEPKPEPTEEEVTKLAGILAELAKVAEEIETTIPRLKARRTELIKEAFSRGGKGGAISDAAKLSTIRVRDLAKS